MRTRNKKSGFFIVEILIVLLIVGILAVALLPNLSTYVQRAKYSDNISAAAAMKPAVELCILQQGNTNLNFGTVPNCTPPAVNYPNGAVAGGSNVNTVTANTANGAITALSNGVTFPTAPTYILTPTYTANPGASGGGTVSWVAGGTCQAAGLC